jgi:hypothetical protein
MKCNCGAKMFKANGLKDTWLCEACGNEIAPGKKQPIDSEHICSKCGSEGRCYDDHAIEDEIGGALVIVGMWAGFVCTNRECRHDWSVFS